MVVRSKPANGRGRDLILLAYLLLIQQACSCSPAPWSAFHYVTVGARQTRLFAKLIIIVKYSLQNQRPPNASSRPLHAADALLVRGVFGTRPDFHSSAIVRVLMSCIRLMVCRFS
jgi:hypothetical protein